MSSRSAELESFCRSRFFGPLNRSPDSGWGIKGVKIVIVQRMKDGQARAGTLAESVFKSFSVNMEFSFFFWTETAITTTDSALRHRPGSAQSKYLWVRQPRKVRQSSTERDNVAVRRDRPGRLILGRMGPVSKPPGRLQSFPNGGVAPGSRSGNRPANVWVIAAECNKDPASAAICPDPQNCRPVQRGPETAVGFLDHRFFQFAAPALSSASAVPMAVWGG